MLTSGSGCADIAKRLSMSTDNNRRGIHNRFGLCRFSVRAWPLYLCPMQPWLSRGCSADFQPWPCKSTRGRKLHIATNVPGTSTQFTVVIHSGKCRNIVMTLSWKMACNMLLAQFGFRC
eukprot:6294322-Amphidinium_carterae.1